jgi:uncharacterized protein YutE (UPF0331/DUF86 family)
MDRLVLQEKLESLARCVRRIELKRPPNLDLLVGDPDLQDILVLNLTRAVQLCVDIGSHVISDTDAAAPQTMGEVFSTLQTLGVISAELASRLRGAVGFRNIAVHNYDRVDWAIVFAISSRYLDDFRTFAAAVVREQEQGPQPRSR